VSSFGVGHAVPTMTSREPHRNLNSTQALYSAIQRRRDHFHGHDKETGHRYGYPAYSDPWDYGTPWERSRRVRINKAINPKTVASVAVIDYLPL
jgi:hypothetical protein